MVLSQDLYYQFPWLNGSNTIFNEILQSRGVNPIESSMIDIIKWCFVNLPELKSKILEFFENLVNSKEELVNPDDKLTRLAMYAIMQILLSWLGNRVLGNAIANAYAKDLQVELERKELTSITSKDKYSDEQIREICENLNIKCEVIYKKIIDEKKYPFKMDFISYLQTAAKIPENRWKLINRVFQEGYVYLIRHEICLILRETVRKKILPDFSPMDKSLQSDLETIPEIFDIVERVKDLINEHTQRFQMTSFLEGEKIGFELYPPCIRLILYRLNQGENLSHMERLAVAFFFINTNHTSEETVDLFRTSPDFDEKIARYQVEFIAGVGGKGKKYTMYSCNKMKSLHICAATHPQFGDILCQKGAQKRTGDVVEIRNPARDYLFWKKVALNRIHQSQITAIDTEILDETDVTSTNNSP